MISAPAADKSALVINLEKNLNSERNAEDHHVPRGEARAWTRQNSDNLEHNQELAEEEEKNFLWVERSQLDEERKVLVQAQKDKMAEMAMMWAEMERITADIRAVWSHTHCSRKHGLPISQLESHMQTSLIRGEWKFPLLKETLIQRSTS